MTTRRFLFQLLTIVLIAIPMQLSGRSPLAAEEATTASRPDPEDPAIVVTLQQDRDLRPHALDSRSSNEHLWLRFGAGRSIIRRRIPWRDIRAIRIGETEVTQQEAQALAEKTKPASPAFRLPRKGRISVRPKKSGQTGFVTQFQFDARAANWDRDVESDGLSLQLFPADAAGRLHAVDGTLHVELLAEKHVPYHQVRRERGLQLRRVDRWTVAIRRTQFTQNGLTVSLPFRSAHPEFNTRWSNRGLVHVQLVIPGTGTLERTLDGISLRPYAPNRDALELETGRRFFPGELTAARMAF